MSFLLWLTATGGILLVVTLLGRLTARFLLPAGSAWRPETWGWSFALGAAVLCVATAAAVALGRAPGWGSFLAASVLLVFVALAFRLREIGADIPPARAPARVVRALLSLLLAFGVAVYLLRAVNQPMWSNDYLAIWGLKGKTIYFARAFPIRVWPDGLYGFSHPEYPLGLPLLYAGVASLLGRWDDQALALLFPFFQAATLVVLFGWLRRRAAPWPVPLAAAAILSLFEPLYSGFLTGMAEIPLSAVFLLFGTALSDGLDGTDSGAARRLAIASLLAAGLKNEGLYLAAAGGITALGMRSPGRGRIAACAFLPAAAVAALSRVTCGNAPLRDFDFSFLGPRISELPARTAETLRTVVDVALPAWPLLLSLLLLLAAGRRTPFADRLLGLAAACLAAYLLLPLFAVPGPAWLVRTTLARTSAALAPLVAAGIAARLRDLGAPGVHDSMVP